MWPSGHRKSVPAGSAGRGRDFRNPVPSRWAGGIGLKTMSEVNIPGKVMLSGEYAVLYGGMAVMVPVTRQLRVTRSEFPYNEIYPPVVQAALSTPIPRLEHHERKFGIPEVSINRDAFMHSVDRGGKVKLGLGCSAAEAVGVIALRFECAGYNWRDHRDEVMHYAFKAHHQAQGGLGSGADVAACVFEKPIYYRLVNDQPFVEPVKAPSKVRTSLAMVWTGQSADTRLLVERFSSWGASGSRQAKNLIPRLIELSKQLAPLWFVPTSMALFNLLSDYNAVLGRCVREANIPYQLPVHRELTTWAVKHGGKAKPLGAGGGDMLLLIGDLPYAELDRLVIRLRF